MQKGFSLTELLVVMGMMTILLSIGGLSLATIRVKSQLDLVASEVRSELLRAQAKSSNGVDSGVFFQAGRFVYFEDPSYTEGDLGNQETTLTGSMTFSQITFSGGIAEFNGVTGYLESFVNPSQVVLQDASGLTKTISVNRWGVVEID